MVLRRSVIILGFSLVFFGGLFSINFFDESNVPQQPPQEIKSNDYQAVGENIDQSVSISPGETSKIVESDAIKSNFQFNAVAPHWKESDANEANRKFEIRTSLDNKNWSAWLEVEAVGALREDEPNPDRMYSEAPIMGDGQYFQYKVSLSRDNPRISSPKLYDLKINYIDSRKKEQKLGFSERVKGLFKSDKASAAQQHPRVISRSEWGSPDPYGDLYKGTDRYWPPAQKAAKQIFIHHTVTASYQSDPSAAVRAVWDFHANTRGWGDVGYNYLVDSSGNVYQGRLGGDNAVGGHVLNYNRGSMGVALLGCFDSQNPTCRQLNGGSGAQPNNQVFEGLTSFLSNKATSYEINPWGSNNFCDVNDQNCLNLPTITGHRDAGQTGCPGNLTVNILQSIRNGTKAKNDIGWDYSAKQIDYDPVDLSTTASQNVTRQFKNTGRSTWYNSGNIMSLYNMEPPGRSSIFKGTGWINGFKPAKLNETSVAPGSTGSFTFNLTRPNIAPGRYLEAHTIITNNGNTPGTFYSTPVVLSCTIGQSGNPRPNGSLIKDVSDNKVYLIEDGQKRYITSSIAAVTNGLDLPYATGVANSEVVSLPNGANINIKEGTLLKSKESSSIYILDKDASSLKRRWVSSGSVMTAFGMKLGQVHTISQASLSSFEAGPNLNSASLIPDGRLARGSDGRVYIVEDGQKRYITSPVVFNSNGFNASQIGAVSDTRINELSNGPLFNLLRSGTLVKASSSPDIYVIDTDASAVERRRITTPYAFSAAGYRYEAIVSISQESINGYGNAESVECYK